MDDKTYDKLLDKAYKELPEVLYSGTRFEIPTVSGKLIKSRTLITNFDEIAKTLLRDKAHLLKFFLREAGVRGDINNRGELTLYSRFQPTALNKIIERYYYEFVECPYCRSPDTEIIAGNNLKCKACGHQEKIKGL